MSDSVRPQRRQPSRLPRPWDSPGKNTGVGCHFLLQCIKVKSESEVAHSVVSDSQRPHGLQPTRLLRPWGFPGKRTGAGCHCLLRRAPQSWGIGSAVSPGFSVVVPKAATRRQHFLVFHNYLFPLIYLLLFLFSIEVELISALFVLG